MKRLVYDCRKRFVISFNDCFPTIDETMNSLACISLSIRAYRVSASVRALLAHATGYPS